MIVISNEDLLKVLSLASKVCEHHRIIGNALAENVSEMDARQFMALAFNAEQVLRWLDERHPALLPLPHDGVAWRDRP